MNVFDYEPFFRSVYIMGRRERKEKTEITNEHAMQSVKDHVWNVA